MITDNSLRKIIHIDMDAFFASIEQRDFPEYRGKPLVVGSDRPRDVVAAASYEARKFGIYSAMPSVIAKRKCPDLIFAHHRFEVYKEVSAQIREIFYEYTDLVEPLSLDEAYLDVTQNKKNITSATQIAQEIREKIFNKTQLTASAGVSYNKFIAKIASDINKPNGICVIKPQQAMKFLSELKIEKFYGVGKVTAARMKEMGIYSGADLLKWQKNDLLRIFGKSGIYYYDAVRGIDMREVVPEYTIQSIGAENTFEQDLDQIEDIYRELELLAKRVHERMERKKVSGKTIILKIRFPNFQQITRSKTLHKKTAKENIIYSVAKELFDNIYTHTLKARLLGISVTNLDNKTDLGDRQLSLDL